MEPSARTAAVCQDAFFVGSNRIRAVGSCGSYLGVLDISTPKDSTCDLGLKTNSSLICNPSFGDEIAHTAVSLAKGGQTMKDSTKDKIEGKVHEVKGKVKKRSDTLPTIPSSKRRELTKR